MNYGTWVDAVFGAWAALGTTCRKHRSLCCFSYEHYFAFMSLVSSPTLLKGNYDNEWLIILKQALGFYLRGFAEFHFGLVVSVEESSKGSLRSRVGQASQFGRLVGGQTTQAMWVRHTRIWLCLSNTGDLSWIPASNQMFKSSFFFFLLTWVMWHGFVTELTCLFEPKPWYFPYPYHIVLEPKPNHHVTVCSHSQTRNIFILKI